MLSLREKIVVQAALEFAVEGDEAPWESLHEAELRCAAKLLQTLDDEDREEAVIRVAIRAARDGDESLWAALDEDSRDLGEAYLDELREDGEDDSGWLSDEGEDGGGTWDEN